jgi:hypothetical protein
MEVWIMNQDKTEFQLNNDICEAVNCSAKAATTILVLLVIHNLTRFFKDSIGRKKIENASVLKQTIGMVCKICGKNKVALVFTGDSNNTTKGMIPKPTGGLFLKHAANVIVNVKEQLSNSLTNPSFKATLLKHQYIKTPKSTILYIKKAGGTVLLD